MSQSPPQPEDHTPPSGTRLPKPQYQPPAMPPNPAYPYPAPVQRREVSVTAILVGLYMIALSIVSLCSAMLALGCGGVLGGIGNAVSSFTSLAPQALEEASDALGYTIVPGNNPAAIPDVGGIVSLSGALVSIVGILSLILAIALIVMAIGLIFTKGWAYWGSLILNAAYIGIQLVNAVIGGITGTGGLSIIQIIFIVLCVVAIAALLMDTGVKRALGRA